MQRTRLGSFILVGTVLLLARSASAGVVLTATQVGNDVVIFGGGTLDTTLWMLSTSQMIDTGVDSEDGLWIGPSAMVDIYGAPTNLTGPAIIGPGNFGTMVTSGSGNTFGLGWSGVGLYVPAGYLSGSQLNGSATFANHTIASLGLAQGTYEWLWTTSNGADDFFRINVVPAPGAVALLGVAGIALRRRRRA